MVGDCGEITTVVDKPRQTYDDSDTPMNNEGCRRLAVAVLQQAISDLQLPTKSLEYPSALAFVTSNQSDWRKQREFWASCAGMDPDALCEHALRMVERGNVGAPTMARGSDNHRQEEVWL